MKFSSDEGRAVAFVLGLIGLAIASRIVTRPEPGDVPATATVDAAALEDSSEQALTAARARAKALGRDERVDVNNASVAELDRLPGVGPGLAARIVQERESAGAFDSAADLRNVRGIGARLLGKLEPHLAFGAAPGLTRRSASPVIQSGGGKTRTSAGETGVSSLGPASLLDLNTATVTDLDALPGVGPALAARIIAKRDSVNSFQNVDDLKKVRGIGSATLERLRPFFR